MIRFAAMMRVERGPRLQVAHLAGRGLHEPELRGRLLDALGRGQPGHVEPQSRAFSRLSAEIRSAIACDVAVHRSRSTLKNTIPASSTKTRAIQPRPDRRASRTLPVRRRAARVKGAFRTRTGSATAGAPADAAGQAPLRARRRAVRRTPAPRVTRGRSPCGSALRRGLRPRSGSAARRRARRGAAAARAIRRSPPSELACGAQAARLGARVVCDLAGRRHDGAAGDQLGLGLAPAHADREVGRADAAARALGEEALHAPVLERVEGDRREPAALAQHLPRERERAVERVELGVHRDPDRLEHSLGRAAGAEAPAHGGRQRGLDRGNELAGRLDRRALAARARSRARSGRSSGPRRAAGTAAPAGARPRCSRSRARRAAGPGPCACRAARRTSRRSRARERRPASRRCRGRGRRRPPDTPSSRSSASPSA